MNMRLASRHLAAGVLVVTMSAVAAASGRTPSQVAPAQPPVVGEAARDFTLTRIDGKTVTLSALRGSGPVVVLMLRGWVGYQ
jgi:cytochrome oxidase Cu insertion factor (SCO1/SenC/PrrC family)